MTTSIQLRDVTDADLPIFFEQQLDPEATRMAAFPSRDDEKFMGHWARIRVDKSIILKTILFNGQVAGNILSFLLAEEREVGYWLGKEYWGKGIASQALAAFLTEIKNAAVVRTCRKTQHRFPAGTGKMRIYRCERG